MKKILAITLALITAALFVSCSGAQVQSEPTESAPAPTETAAMTNAITDPFVPSSEPTAAPSAEPTDVPTTEPATEASTQPAHVHTFTDVIRKKPGMLEDGVMHRVCSECGEEFDEPIPATRSIKILAFGNSFSDDGFRNLPYVLKDLGFKEVILGNLYIGSCSLDMHWDNIKSGANAYLFRETHIDGLRVDYPNKNVKYAMEKYDWDFIIVQQKGNWCGDSSKFSVLGNVLSYIDQNKSNPTAKIFWHMTWSYRNGVNPSQYGGQLAFYNAIANVTKNTVMTKKLISGLIPSGTAIQNARTSMIGDNFNHPDDGFHLGPKYGYYTAALTWACAILKVSPGDVTWKPVGMTDDEAAAIKEAVGNAIKKPYAVTKSTYN